MEMVSGFFSRSPCAGTQLLEVFLTYEEINTFPIGNPSFWCIPNLCDIMDELYIAVLLTQNSISWFAVETTVLFSS